MGKPSLTAPLLPSAKTNSDRKAVGIWLNKIRKQLKLPALTVHPYEHGIRDRHSVIHDRVELGRVSKKLPATTAQISRRESGKVLHTAECTVHAVVITFSSFFATTQGCQEHLCSYRQTRTTTTADDDFFFLMGSRRLRFTTTYTGLKSLVILIFYSTF